MTMPWLKLLFSFQGRATRRDFWVRFILPMLGIWIAVQAVLPVDALIDPRPLGDAEADPWASLTPLAYALMLASNWVALTVGVKRFHDRNRSGWWLLLYLVPLLDLWVVLEVGFLRGSRGPNRFGPDPLDQSPSDT